MRGRRRGEEREQGEERTVKEIRDKETRGQDRRGERKKGEKTRGKMTEQGKDRNKHEIRERIRNKRRGEETRE